MVRRASNEDVENAMVQLIVEAIYPVLHPIEQQDCRIQAENHARATEAATVLWRYLRAGTADKKMVCDALNVVSPEVQNDVATD